MAQCPNLIAMVEKHHVQTSLSMMLFWVDRSLNKTKVQHCTGEACEAVAAVFLECCVLEESGYSFEPTFVDLGQFVDLQKIGCFVSLPVGCYGINKRFIALSVVF